MVDHYNLTESKMEEIINKRETAMSNMVFFTCKAVQLLEIPEGTHRPRFRVIKKNNYNRIAMQDEFVHVYTPNAQDDFKYMHQMVNDELVYIDGLINTPCIIDYYAYYKTPSYYNTTDIFLAETGLFRPPIDKPDWDNCGKKYCDMYNHNIWLDDALVLDGAVHKYYSILPRVEIYLRYLNCVYTKAQYNRIIQRKDYDGSEIHYLDKHGRMV